VHAKGAQAPGRKSVFETTFRLPNAASMARLDLFNAINRLFILGIARTITTNFARIAKSQSRFETGPLPTSQIAISLSTKRPGDTTLQSVYRISLSQSMTIQSLILLFYCQQGPLLAMWPNRMRRASHVAAKAAMGSGRKWEFEAASHMLSALSRTLTTTTRYTTIFTEYCSWPPHSIPLYKSTSGVPRARSLSRFEIGPPRISLRATSVCKN
jgi:hypothetical protein